MIIRSGNSDGLDERVRCDKLLKCLGNRFNEIQQIDVKITTSNNICLC